VTLARKLKKTLSSKRKEFVAVGMSAAPYVHVYPWDSSTGFGAKLANPSSALASQVQNIAFHPTGKAIAFARVTSSSLFDAYAFSATGFGTRYTTPAASPAVDVADVAFSPDGNWIMVFTAPDTRLYVYPFTLGGGVGALVAGYPVTIGINSRRLSWHPSGTYVSLALDGSPFIRAYPFNLTTGALGTAINASSALSTGFYHYARWSASGMAIAAGLGGTPPAPVLSGYPFSGGAFGARLTSPASGYTSSYSGAFSPQNTFVVTALETTPFIAAWPWSDATGHGAKLSDPAVLPPGWVTDVEFSGRGDAVFFTSTSSPHIGAYAWNNALGARYPNPATLPTSGACLAYGRI